jgi:hypothetical protein
MFVNIINKKINNLILKINIVKNVSQKMSHYMMEMKNGNVLKLRNES